MRINLKKLTETAVLPERGSSYAAGYDLFADVKETLEIAPHKTAMIPTGLAMEIPEGYFGGIFARSGLATKKSLRPANAVGVIDSDYRGNIIVALHNDSNIAQYIDAKERIAQLVIIPYQEVEFEEVNELDDTSRGDGGFGSTGTK